MKALLPGLVLVLCCTATTSPRAEPAAVFPPAQVAANRGEPARFVDGTPETPSAAARLRTIRKRIQAALVYPPLARSDALEGSARVRFDIGRDGIPRDVVLSHSSGRPSLDRAALRAVDDAAPLPWVYGRLEVPVRFALEPRQ